MLQSERQSGIDSGWSGGDIILGCAGDGMLRATTAGTSAGYVMTFHFIQVPFEKQITLQSKTDCRDNLLGALNLSCSTTLELISPVPVETSGKSP
jgi:hypothetical protein